MNVRQAVVLVITALVVVLLVVNPPQVEMVTYTIQINTFGGGPGWYRHWTVREPVERFYSKVRTFPSGRQPAKEGYWRQTIHDPNRIMSFPELLLHASDVTYETDESRLLGEISLVVACGALLCVLFGSLFTGCAATPSRDIARQPTGRGVAPG